MIFDMFMYVTLIDLTEMECILLILKMSTSLFMVLESLTLDKSK